MATSARSSPLFAQPRRTRWSKNERSRRSSPRRRYDKFNRRRDVPRRKTEGVARARQRDGCRNLIGPRPRCVRGGVARARKQEHDGGPQKKERQSGRVKFFVSG